MKVFVRPFAAALLLCACFLLTALPSPAADTTWNPLIERLTADGYDPAGLQVLFDHFDEPYDPSVMGQKLRTLYARRYERDLVRTIQTRLKELRFDPGVVDGVIGRNTRSAICTYQKFCDLPQTGRPSWELIWRLMDDERLRPNGFAMVAPPSVKTDSGKRVYSSVAGNEALLNAARSFARENAHLLAATSSLYGVPAEVAVGIITVETRLGGYLGEKPALITLASMAMSDDFTRVEDELAGVTMSKSGRRWVEAKGKEKADWAYAELKALLDYCVANDIDPAVPGSHYGAIGIGQFMPTNAIKFGIDGDANGKVDLFNLIDAVHSVANYLKHHGWSRPELPERSQRKVIYRYNHSTTYVNTVLYVAEHVRNG
jgi:membrane-bound lytic murein transglycosylase B